MQVVFGAGTVMGKRIDVTGLPIIFFGVTQEWSLDVDQKIVQLMGQYKDPVDIAPGERTVTGKIKFARVQATAMGNLIFGSTPTAGAGFSIIGPENHSSIATTTFVVSNGATFLQDLGLFYHNTGIALQPTAAAPTAGYYIAGNAGTGIYTIAAADESVTGGIDAYYQVSTTNQYEVDVSQALMGTGPIIELDMNVPYNVSGAAKQLNVQIYAARITKTPMTFKNNGYLVPECDFQCFTNQAGNLLRWASTE